MLPISFFRYYLIIRLCSENSGIPTVNIYLFNRWKNATDNVLVTNVTANDVELTFQGGNIWNGTIITIDGTNSVNVSANDAAGNNGWNNSTSYTSTTTNTTPPVPTDLQNTTGNYWIEYIWSPGNGVTTDGYNVSINGTWSNTTNMYLNVTVGPSG